MDELFAIPGVNLAGALERFGGPEGLFATLRSYAAHTPGLLEELRGAPPLDRYAVTVHGIKGASRNIGAEAAGALAEALEEAARAGDGAFVAAHTADFIAAVKELVAAVQKALDEAETRQEKPLREQPDPALLAQIAEAAAAYDIGALDAALETLEQYRYRSGGDLPAWLRNCLERSEFEEIQRRLAVNHEG